MLGYCGIIAYLATTFYVSLSQPAAPPSYPVRHHPRPLASIQPIPSGPPGEPAWTHVCLGEPDDPYWCK